MVKRITTLVLILVLVQHCCPVHARTTDRNMPQESPSPGHPRATNYETKNFTFQFEQGWNMVSMNIIPTDSRLYRDDERGPNVMRMFGSWLNANGLPVIHLIKDADGRFCIPDWDFNVIPYWDVRQGYQINAEIDCAIGFYGAQIPADTTIHLEEHWNIIGYPPDYELAAEAPDFHVLSSIIESVIIAKDNDGNVMYPDGDFSNMPPWRPGQGYQLRVRRDVELVYPGIDVVVNPFPAAIGENSPVSYWGSVEKTGFNLSLLVNRISGFTPVSGDQVGAFSHSGVLLGWGEVNENGRCGLPVWGDDPTTGGLDGVAPGHEFSLRYWNRTTNTGMNLEVDFIHAGNGLRYKQDDLIVLDVSGEIEVPQDIRLAQVYPNPFNSNLRIDLHSRDTKNISIRIYDQQGRLIELLHTGTTPLNRSLSWDAHHLSAGEYFLHIRSGSREEATPLLLTK